MQVLPPELWIQIIRELPSHYQRSCLSVSTLFHDISLPFVFASINIRLGLLRDHYVADEDHYLRRRISKSEVQTEAELAIRHSSEVLQHVVRFPTGRLARAVKTLSIRAYSYGYEEHFPREELLDALEEALSILQLRAFAWFGCHPMPRSNVLEALSAASENTLESIILPYYPASIFCRAELLDHTSLLAFGHLKSLSFLNRYADDYRYVDDEDPQLDAMRQTITVKAPSLRSLGVFDEVLSKCNVQRLSTLVDLTVVLFTDVECIAEVFTHCSQLRSLTVLSEDADFADLATALHAHSDALPLLAAFRLSCGNITVDEAQTTATFLRKKPLLERLELGHYCYDWHNPSYSDAVEPVLEILPELSRLRVLGCKLSGNRSSPALRADHLLRLSQRIPPQLTALSLLVTTWGMSDVTEADWIQFFLGLRSCRFIYTSTDRDFNDIYPLQYALFDHPPPSAELVGFNEDIGWVERKSGSGEVWYSESWPLSKVYYRTAEEFGSEEWEWLLKNVHLRLM